jgi:hypothetical protein
MANYNFPRRFAIEGLNPLELRVKYVFKNSVGRLEVKYFDTLEDFEEHRKGLSALGPMWDIEDSEPFVRFESSEAYRQLSA